MRYAFAIATAFALLAQVGYVAGADTAAQRGYRWLTTNSYVPPDFDQTIFDELWKQWPEPLRKQAEKATADERRAMAFSQYGLTPRPGDDSAKPLQYVVDKRGNWTMNCFACHGGKVAGKVIPGIPNSHYALQTLTEDVRMTKLLTQKPLAHMDLGSMAMPLGRTNGTTNAVMFGVALVAQRNPDLSMKSELRVPPMTHHDMDAPPWWQFKKKKMLYIDGFANKGAKPLMQFMLVKENGPDKFHGWVADFEDIYAYIESVEAPAYPYEIDGELAARGKQAFVKHCAECHGTYDDDPARETYLNKLVAIDEVGTDRVRLDALSPAARERYGASWFADFGKKKIIADPGGYVAPPLDGVWASAPYFHNGSVPTLWHVLHPDERPKIWKRTEDGYDQKLVGLEVTTFDSLPSDVDSARETRKYFDTRRFGKSAAGHDFPNALSDDEKDAVLEYLKTL
jgi:mono/diheme cytochrome c family protein/cytochrome c553